VSALFAASAKAGPVTKCENAVVIAKGHVRRQIDRAICSAIDLKPAHKTVLIDVDILLPPPIRLQRAKRRSPLSGDVVRKAASRRHLCRRKRGKME
jgi:hypothetical protein